MPQSLGQVIHADILSSNWQTGIKITVEFQETLGQVDTNFNLPKDQIYSLRAIGLGLWVCLAQQWSEMQFWESKCERVRLLFNVQLTWQGH